MIEEVVVFVCKLYRGKFENVMLSRDPCTTIDPAKKYVAGTIAVIDWH